MKIICLTVLGLAITCLPLAQNSGLELSHSVDVEANRRNSFEEFKKSATEYLTPVSELGKLIYSVMSMVGVDNAVTLSITNNHPVELTNPKWYILDGRLDTPPPDILATKQTMIVTFERHPNSIVGSLLGTEGVLTYKMGTSYLVILWSAVPTRTNKYLVKIVDEDPNPGDRALTTDIFKKYKVEAMEAGDFGSWLSNKNVKMNCDYITSMGNGDKAPFEIFLSKSS